MATLENRPHTALLVVDVQVGVVAGAHARDAVVANIGRLVEQARRERVPVVWVQHADEQLARGSDDWRIVPELAPGDAELLVDKRYGDAFEDCPGWLAHPCEDREGPRPHPVRPDRTAADNRGRAGWAYWQDAAAARSGRL